MTIGIIGSGKMVRRSLDSSHVRAEEVAIANSRGPETLADLVADIGAKTRALTMEEAMAFGDVVVLATTWRRREELPDSERFTGKLVVDAMNPCGAEE